MYKKIVILFILSVLTLSISGCYKKNSDETTLDKILKRGKIIVGVKYDAKPFGYLNKKNQLVGFDVDLAKIIAKALLGDENKIIFKPVTTSNRILALNSGQVDMVIATMTITNQRREVVDFSVPYYVTGQSLLVPLHSKITSMTDLNGKKVIVIFGSTAEKNLRLIAPEANVLGFKTYISGYNALKQGMADAMTSDDTILLGFAIQDKSVKLLPKKYSKEPYAVAFKRGIVSESLRQEVNRILDQETRTGGLEMLRNKWIKY